MAEGWWLPEATVLAIRNHHEVSSLMPGSARIGLVSRQLIAVAQLAEWLMQQATGMNKNNEWAKLGEACLAQLDMPGTDLAALELRAAAFLDSLDPL
jgi:HD-like signal output (HDOD) protein